MQSDVSGNRISLAALWGEKGDQSGSFAIAQEGVAQGPGARVPAAGWCNRWLNSGFLWRWSWHVCAVWEDLEITSRFKGNLRVPATCCIYVTLFPVRLKVLKTKAPHLAFSLLYPPISEHREFATQPITIGGVIVVDQALYIISFNQNNLLRRLLSLSPLTKWRNQGPERLVYISKQKTPDLNLYWIKAFIHSN